MNEQELFEHLSESVGLTPDDVARVLCALADTAYHQSKEGFVLPGFGMFRVVQGAERTVAHPFTGKDVTFKAPPDVTFTVNSDAKEAFIKGARPHSVDIRQVEKSRQLPEIRLLPSSEDLTAARIKSVAPTGGQCKLGGEPDWIQSSEVPVCCGQAMLFYGQLDSIGGPFSLGDVGMIYAFICETCASPRAIFQCH